MKKSTEQEKHKENPNFMCRFAYEGTPVLKSHQMTATEAMIAFRTGNTDISELAFIPVIDEDEDADERF